VPEQVRGFGHVKEKAIAKMRTEQARLLARFDAAPMPEGSAQRAHSWPAPTPATSPARTC
jgi:hypothetical protein